MGKYLPIITTAECGSMTRAAHVLGYTQPSLGYIINNMEDELGVKLFYRDQRGVSLTETGATLLEIMRQIETMENQLRETASASRGGLLRVGTFPSVASQWMPAVLAEFYQTFPDAVVKLEPKIYYMDGEIGVREHSLECSFSVGPCPAGLERVNLYDDTYYLVVGEDSALAGRKSVSVEELAGSYPFIPNNESFDPNSTIREVYEALGKNTLVDFAPQDNQVTIALVEQGLGITVLPGLAVAACVSGKRVKVIPLTDNLTRNVCLLCPKGAERTSLTSAFLRLVQKRVQLWAEAQRAAAEKS